MWQHPELEIYKIKTKQNKTKQNKTIQYILLYKTHKSIKLIILFNEMLFFSAYKKVLTRTCNSLIKIANISHMVDMHIIQLMNRMSLLSQGSLARLYLSIMKMRDVLI